MPAACRLSIQIDWWLGPSYREHSWRWLKTQKAAWLGWALPFPAEPTTARDNWSLNWLISPGSAYCPTRKGQVWAGSFSTTYSMK